MEKGISNVLCTKVDEHAGDWPSQSFLDLFFIARKCVEPKMVNRPEIAEVGWALGKMHLSLAAVPVYRNIACALAHSCHRCTCEILVLEVVIDNYCLHEAQHVTLYLLALFHLLQVYPELEQLVTKSAELYAEQQVLIKGTTRTHDSRV